MSGARFYALIERAPASQESRHDFGSPPALADGEDRRVPLPAARVLELHAEPSGVVCYRHSHAGARGGETWHRPFADAKHRAEPEYGEALGSWQVVPDDADAASAYALHQVTRSAKWSDQ
jgi:hypothetical protein